MDINPTKLVPEKETTRMGEHPTWELVKMIRPD